MKKLFSLLLILCMLLSLTACGESGPADPNCGLYVGVYGEAYGVQLDIHEMYEKGFTIELKNGGKGQIEVDGTKAGLKWTRTGDAIHIEGTGISGRDLVLDGTISSGVMTLENVMDSGVAIRLECAELMKAGALTAPEQASAEPEQAGAAPEQASAEPEPEIAKDPNAGVYEGIYGIQDGVKTEIHVMYEEGFTVELEEGGKGSIDVDGTQAGLNWTLDGEALRIEGTGIYGKDLVLEGSLAEGVMLLTNVLDTGIDIRLECDELVPAGGSDRGAVSTAVNPDWWNGTWYGWGVYYVVGGIYSDLEDQAWDVTAQIDVNGNTGTLQIWDIEDLEEAEFTAEVRFAPGEGEAGSMVCKSGSFADAQMANGEWVCDPAATPEGRLEHTFCLEYIYEDPENSDNFVYICYILRPWGMLWDDVRSADTSEMLYEDMMPLHYEDWYLPQLG